MGIQREFELQVSLSRWCPCCAGDWAVGQLIPLPQPGPVAFRCETCACVVTSPDDGAISLLANGLDCAGARFVVGVTE